MYDEEVYERDFLLDAAYEGEQELLYATTVAAVEDAARAHGLNLEGAEREDLIEELRDGAEIEWDCGDEREDLEWPRPIVRFRKSALLVVAKALPVPARQSAPRPIYRPRPHARRRRRARVHSGSRGSPGREPPPRHDLVGAGA